MQRPRTARLGTERTTADRVVAEDWLTIGKVIPPSATDAFTVLLRPGECRVGDFVAAAVPSGTGDATSSTTIWGRVSKMEIDPERTSVLARVTPLGASMTGDASSRLYPVDHPLRPGTPVVLPSAEAVQALIGAAAPGEPSLRLGAVLGRPDIVVTLSAERVVSRHLAVLAMTGAGKTVAVKRLVRALLGLRYPVLVLDPHGDYLGLWRSRGALPGATIRVFHPHLTVTPDDRDLVEALTVKTTQGLTDAQAELFTWLLQTPASKRQRMNAYLDSLIDRAARGEAGEIEGTPRIQRNTFLAVRRMLRALRSRVSTMEATSERLRRAQHGIKFEPLPDIRRDPEAIVAPGQLSIIYLGGYEEIMQSAVVSLMLEALFEHRTALKKRIPPVLTVVEEAHTFLPANRSAADVASLATLRRILTEGRKFGMGAILVTQRPSLVDATALAQCNSFLAMRLINANDQAYVAAIVENLSPSEIAALSTLGPGQGIVAGQAVRMPTIVQVDLDHDLLEGGRTGGSFVREAGDWKRPRRAARSGAEHA